MHILGKKLSKPEQDLFVYNSMDGLLAFLYFVIDILITFGVVYAMITHPTYDLLRYIISGYYLGMLIYIIFAIYGYSTMVNKGNYPPILKKSLLRLTNNILDWPFGQRALPHITKHVVTVLVLIYGSMISGWHMVGIIVSIIGMGTLIIKYYQAILTLIIMNKALSNVKPSS